MEKQTGQFRRSDEEAPYKDLSVIETEEFEE
jgi:hypothetical protein